ncbi:MAG: hypothetical protein JNJ90_13115 [Saprospiraceae bacterium]|nr:hypothetical protein [Saprospiraceae bacterium]
MWPFQFISFTKNNSHDVKLHRSPLTAHRSPLTAHRFTLAFLFTICTMLVHAQGVVECSAPGLSPQQRQAILAEIDTTGENAVASGSVAANGVWKVGVWFYHLRQTNGSSNIPNPDAEQAIEAVNTYFGGLFEFHLCGSTTIDNDDYADLDIETDLGNLWTHLSGLNQPDADKCVRVFLTNTGNVKANGNPLAVAYAYDPLNYSYPGVFLGGMGSQTWAHELGHYFGLPHTYLGGADRQYVHHATNPEDYPVTISGLSYTCLHTGDGFCDTPADPGECSITNCQITSCPTGFDPLGLPYNPDPTLLMGYGGCGNRFSDEQRQVMRYLYQYIPDYAFLKPPPEECIFPTFGHIERNCEDVLINNSVSPIIYVPVEVQHAANLYCDPQDNMTNTLGRYQIKPCPLPGTLRRVYPDRNFGNNPLNGVTAFDMVRINQHILGVVPFPNPFQMVAADVNNNGGISSSDIIAIRMLILGLIQQFPSGMSWRYVPKLFTENTGFWNAFSFNPFATTVIDDYGIERHYKEGVVNGKPVSTWMDFVYHHLNSAVAGAETAWSFTGVKLGDVNCNADIDDSSFSGDDHEFLIDSSSLTSVNFSGTKRVQVIASASREVVAWQFGARYASDSLILFDLAPGTDAELFDEENFSIAPDTSLPDPGHLRAIWYAEDDEPVSIHNKVLFEFDVTASQGTVNLADALQLDKNVLPFFFYDEDGVLVPNVSLTLHISNVPQGLRRPTLPGTNPRASKSLRTTAYPMPFTSEVAISFELPGESRVQLDIFDATGTLVSSNYGIFPARLNEISVTDLAQRPSGFYWYILRAGDMTAQGKLGKR